MLRFETPEDQLSVIGACHEKDTEATFRRSIKTSTQERQVPTSYRRANQQRALLIGETAPGTMPELRLLSSELPRPLAPLQSGLFLCAPLMRHELPAISSLAVLHRAAENPHCPVSSSNYLRGTGHFPVWRL
jgi:hypothetical protein